MSGQLGERDAGGRRERLTDVVDAAMEPRDLRVDLEPVAGREDDGLGDVLVPDQLGLECPGLHLTQGGALEQADRRRAIGEADHEFAHRRASAVLTSSTPWPLPLA